jgi:hypothetical protein
MYDRPLTPDEQNALTPAVKRAMQNGDRNQLDMETRIINDQIKDRVQGLDTAISYISDGYKADLAASQQNKQWAMGMLDKVISGGVSLDTLKNTYGSNLVNTIFQEAGMPQPYIPDDPQVKQMLEQGGGGMPGVGQDGYADPQTYQAIRSSYLQTNPQYTQEQFDRTYGNVLNPDDASSMGINQAGGTSLSSDFYTNAQTPDQLSDQGNTIDPNINNTPNAVYQDAITYMESPNPSQALSGMGFGQKTAVSNYRMAVKSKAAAMAQALGKSELEMRTMFKANSAATTQIVQRVGKIEATAQALQAQFPRLSQLADQVKSEGVQLQESDIQAGSAYVLQHTGSVNASNYVELLQTVRGDYQAMQQALGGGRGGEYLQRTAIDAIPAGLSSEQLTGLQSTIQKSAQVSIDATKDVANQLLSGSDVTSQLNQINQGGTGASQTTNQSQQVDINSLRSKYNY